MQKVNVLTVNVVTEKKTLPMKVVASSLTTQENANHVNKKLIINTIATCIYFVCCSRA